MLSAGVSLNWTPVARECYERGCNCEDCPIFEMLETQCVLKKVVIEIVRVHGKPPADVEKLDINEIIRLLDSGKNLKKIAELKDVPYNNLLRYTSSNGVSGYCWAKNTVKRTEWKRRKNERKTDK